MIHLTNPTHTNLYLTNVALDESEVLVSRWPLPLLARDLGYPIGAEGTEHNRAQILR